MYPARQWLAFTGRTNRGEMSDEPTLEFHNDGQDLFVLVDGVKIPKRATPAHRIGHDLPVPARARERLGVGQYGMFFPAQHRENGVYTAANPCHPALVAAPAHNTVASDRPRGQSSASPPVTRPSPIPRRVSETHASAPLGIAFGPPACASLR
jgi:hypothetical protein